MAAPSPQHSTPSSLPRLLRRRDVAELVGLSERTIERLDAEGRGPRKTIIGRSIRFRPEDVRDWLDQRAQHRP